MNELYQGCGRRITPDELPAMERSGKWIAEPKYDGNWVSVRGTGNGSPKVANRPGRSLRIGGLAPLPVGTVVAGEWAGGTQAGETRRLAVGHESVDVFDLLFADGQDLRSESRATRQAALDVLFSGHPAIQKTYRRSPVFTERFAERFEEQTEGLVLKPVDDGAYRTGDNPRWVKCKFTDTTDYVVLDWLASTKRRVKSLVVGGWVPSRQVATGEKVYERATIGGSRMALVGLSNIGSLNLATQEHIVMRFGRLRGRVIEVSGYGQFDSGSTRNPSLVVGANDLPVVRRNKTPRECLFRAKAQ